MLLLPKLLLVPGLVATGSFGRVRGSLIGWNSSGATAVAAKMLSVERAV